MQLQPRTCCLPCCWSRIASPSGHCKRWLPPSDQNLTPACSSQGRSKSYHRRGIWAVKKKNNGEFPKHPKQPKAEAKEAKAARFYPADDVKQPLRRRDIKKPTRLRSSIQPGSVLILLAGQLGRTGCWASAVGFKPCLMTTSWAPGCQAAQLNASTLHALPAGIELLRLDVIACP